MSKPIKIALAMIVKPTEEEGQLLAECLTSVGDAVDGIFITQAGPKKNEYVSSVIKMFGGVESFYQWDNNFANARNYNFSQVPKDYDYILWLDADDTITNANLIKETVANNPSVDAFSLWYNYAFDEWGNPIVVHHKTRIVRNDGCVEWMGPLHEDFKKHRDITHKHIEGIEVIHNQQDSRTEQSKSRNIRVAEEAIKELPNDPRSYWNLGNSYKANNQNKEALEAFDTFLKTSKSDDEKYIVHLRRAESLYALDKKDEAVIELRTAIGLKPDYPDAYIHLGQTMYHLGRYQEAISLLKQSAMLRPPTYKIIVFNPMDYEYTPLKWLAYSYSAIDQPMLAYECFKAMLEITPKDERLKEIVALMKQKSDVYNKMLKEYERMKNMDKMELGLALAKLPDEFKNAPMFINLRNKNFIKTETTGKEIAFMCAYTEREWNPESLNEGIGGSEEAVIHLAKAFAKRGYDVTVYNNCGHTEKKFDGVLYKPFYAFNYRDKMDTLILWRHPKLADYDLNAKKVILDLHDVINPNELTESRLKKIDHIFVKSNFHRDLFPNVPDEKFVVVPNGIKYQDLQLKVERDPMLLVNTSSPDRSLSTLIRLFKRVKERVPEAKCKWAYGWGVFDVVHKDSPEIMEWKENIVKGMEDAGIENLGRVSHKEVHNLYNQARIFAYPTEFAEIDCISARKAQAGGALPVTTDFAALNETVINGVKIKSHKTKDDWCLPGQYDFGFTDKEMEDKWVEAVVCELKTKMQEDNDMRKEMKQFDWKNIADKWEAYAKN